MNINHHNLPEHFECRPTDSGILLYDKNYIRGAKAIPALASLPNNLDDKAAFKSRSRSMKTVWNVDAPPWCYCDMIVRQYVHGGLFGKLSGPMRQYFLDSSPMVNEVKIIVYLLRKGIKVAEPIALKLEYTAKFFVKAFLISKKIPDTVNLLQMCRLVENGHLDITDDFQAALFRKITHVVSDMHKTGVYHGDLNLKNLLVKKNAKTVTDEVYIIDFKKAICMKNVGQKAGVKNIRRLWRSILKWPESQAVLGSFGEERLIRNYNERV